MRYPTIHTSLKSFAGHALAGTVGVAALTMILSAAPAAHAQNLDTYGDGSNLQGVYFQGQGPSSNGDSTPTYGQTITAPGAGQTLTSFTFYTENSGSSFDELAEVFAYDTATQKTTGPALSTSTVTIANSANTFLADSVTGLNVALSTNGTYVLLFTSVGANLPSSPADNATFATRYTDQYNGGNFVYNASTSLVTGYQDPGQVQGESYGNGDDLAFKATFTPTVTPEPGMVVTGLSMLSMTGLGLVRGRRRAKAAAKAA